MEDSRDFKAFERDVFNQKARAYETIASTTAQANASLLDAVGARPGAQLLDLACGPGWLSEDAIARGATVTGVDYAEAFVELARQRNPSATFVVGDAEALPLADATFDAVVCNFGVLHFPQPEVALREVFRVLKPGGRFAFTNWTPPPSNPFMAAVLEAIRTYGDPNVDVPAGPPLFRFADEAECESVLTAIGFAFGGVHTVSMPWKFAFPEDVFSCLKASSARLGSVIDKQTPKAQRSIEASLLERARGFVTDGGVEFPSSAVVTAARKPGL